MRTSTLLLACLTAMITLNACDDEVVAPAAPVSKTSTTTDSSKDTAKAVRSFVYGSVSDSDGHTYRTIKIGSQEWMAENLNDSKDMTVGVCLQRRKDSCSRYGRLYTWAEAMQGASSSTASPSKVRGICPIGWHLPSGAEWRALSDLVKGRVLPLKSDTGWNRNDGTDSLGFNALPSNSTVAGYDGNSGEAASWWTSDKVMVEISSPYATLQWDPDILAGYGFSVRCVRDGN